MYLYVIIRLTLTFAGLHTLSPSMINIPVAGTATVLKPRTSRTATTGSAGFLERATLWAGNRFINDH